MHPDCKSLHHCAHGLATGLLQGHYALHCVSVWTCDNVDPPPLHPCWREGTGIRSAVAWWSPTIFCAELRSSLIVQAIFVSLCCKRNTHLVRCAKPIRTVNCMVKPFNERSPKWHFCMAGLSNHHIDLHHYSKVRWRHHDLLNYREDLFKIHIFF